MDPPGPYSLPCYDETEAPDFGDSSPVPEVHGPEENYSCLQVSAAELLRKETASPCPSPVDLPLQDSPDSSTSPKLKLPGPESAEGTEKKREDKVHGKKQKMRTVFSDTQLCALRNRFQRQKYLSLQQMQELSAGLNLSYKQVKTWFQNQRMKCKRWQKSQWPKTNTGVTQKGSAFVEYSSLHSGYPQGFLNTSESLPMWGSQTWSNQTWTHPTWSKQAWSNETWTNPTWSNQAWTNPTWSNQPWCPQAYNSQAWNTPFAEDSLQPYMQCPQNLLASDVEASLEAAGEGHACFSTPQGLELLLNYSANLPGEM
ncbi:homeobox protein NANOG [Mesocricetus auratus]|uniref:Homeobox protein NANOG n=1 Tax=Mesocricetus auratus TaxID=10036 RepID=A0ABM2WQX7_MESAU|nr:homeobox protein NANOG [Mesocricetus auratus]